MLVHTKSYKGCSGQTERIKWSRKKLRRLCSKWHLSKAGTVSYAPRSHLTGLLTWLNPMFLGARIWNHEMCNIYLASDQIFFWSDVVTTELKPVLRWNASSVPRLAHSSFHLKALVICLATQCILIISKSHFSPFQPQKYVGSVIIIFLFGTLEKIVFILKLASL